jgi:hypothetical protein
VRGLTNHAENLTSGSIYLARLSNKRWYRVTIQKIEQDKVEVFCIDTGVTELVEKNLIKVEIRITVF